MGKLIKYLDGKAGCWSRVKLDNSDPIWISVAQTGVVVKKSRTGIMGAMLYCETNVYNAAKTALALDKVYSLYLTPKKMTNPVLRAFTQAALVSNTSADLALLLNRIAEIVSTNDPTEDADRNSPISREQIISDFASYVEQYPWAMEIRDVSVLPHSKKEILDAIILKLAEENDEDRVKFLKTGALFLADFQENVGPKPLDPIGTTLDIIKESKRTGTIFAPDKLRGITAQLDRDSPDRIKYESFRAIADQELTEIERKIRTAEEQKKQPPKREKPSDSEIYEAEEPEQEFTGEIQEGRRKGEEKAAKPEVRQAAPVEGEFGDQAAIPTSRSTKKETHPHER